MDLLCLQANLKGQKISVNGHVYDIGMDGIAHILDEVDAAKLLKFPSWRKPVVRAPVAASKGPSSTEAPEVEAPKGPEAPEVKEPEVAVETLETEIGVIKVRTPAVDADAWPDPEETMEVGYLREMADAYDVKHNEKTTKKALVKAILKAMYE
jgi:hypothetical protein